jgi:hypothetical protein
MKYLEISDLEHVNSLLGQFESMDGSSHILGLAEAYSCKSAGQDKKLYKDLGQRIGLMISFDSGNSADQSNISSTVSDAVDMSSDVHDLTLKRQQNTSMTPEKLPAGYKILYYLIATLNQSFPDYDFRDVDTDQFVSIPSLPAVIDHVQSALFASSFSHPILSLTELSHAFWKALDASIQLKNCDIYSYIPDMDSDPFSENGCIWSLNYFFWNRKLKRIVFFHCRCMLNDDSLSQTSSSATNTTGLQISESQTQTPLFMLRPMTPTIIRSLTPPVSKAFYYDESRFSDDFSSDALLDHEKDSAEESENTRQTLGSCSVSISSVSLS